MFRLGGDLDSDFNESLETILATIDRGGLLRRGLLRRRVEPEPAGPAGSTAAA